MCNRRHFRTETASSKTIFLTMMSRRKEVEDINRLILIGRPEVVVPASDDHLAISARNGHLATCRTTAAIYFLL